MKFLICLYSHIEGYPPTFNAINVLAQEDYDVMVLARKDMETQWEYHENVKIKFVGNYKNRFVFEKTSKQHKIKEFIIYVNALKKLINTTKPDVILLYDNIPLMAYRILNFFSLKNKHKIWYHNHDIHYKKDYKKFSLPYFAFSSLKKSFKFIDLFSLPAKERLKYFNLKRFKGNYHILPNFPPQYLFKFEKKNPPKDIIKMVYPGNISNMHGIEEIISILKNTVNEKSLSLTLVGDIRNKYKTDLLSLAHKHNTKDHLFFIERKPYFQIQKILIQYDIGIAINKPMNITYETGGTAANKLYEYPASGLPSILFDNNHYRKYFDKYEWAHFSNLSEKSLLSNIKSIDDNYLYYSKKAKKDFEELFNFETVFANTLKKFL